MNFPLKLSILYSALTFCHLRVNAFAENNSTKGLAAIQETITCEPRDFADDGRCALSCTWLANGPDYQVTSIQWLYATTSSSTKQVQIFDGVTTSVSGSTYSTELTLSSYYAGYYICQFNYNLYPDESLQDYHSFKIETLASGVNIGSKCVNQSECFALNARCDETNSPGEMTCNCNGNFDLQYDKSTNTPACLQHVEEGGTCGSDVECGKTNESLKCVDNVCTCAGSVVKVASNNGAKMCLQKCWFYNYNEPCYCHYDEQCNILNKNSVCVKGQCTCPYDYVTEYKHEVHNSPVYKCRRYFTVGEYVGMAFGALIALIILIGAGSLIASCFRKI